MKITLNDQELKRIISMYYTDVKNKDVRVSIDPESISVIESLALTKREYKSKEKLSTHELYEILNYFLGSDYNIKSINISKVCLCDSPMIQIYGFGNLEVEFYRVAQKVRTR
jgi:hypothetical protein